MGGSVAAALKKRRLATPIVGYDLAPKVCARAIELGLLDECAATAAQAVRGADLVVLATPVGSMPALLAQIADELAPATLVLDLGSTKGDVVSAAREALGSAFERFVPTHPIAGSERSGPDGAQADLFDGCTVAITAGAETRADAVTRIETLWRQCGARVVRIDAVDHDRILAKMSHLPHLLAFALMAQIADQPDAQRSLSFAGPGFRDFTRIAGANPAMWRDIALANRQAIGQELRALVAMLQRVEHALVAADASSLQRMFELASRTRSGMERNGDGG